MSDKDPRQVKAAADLEEIAIQMKEAIKLMRGQADRQLSYALVYELRHRLGRVVTSLGYAGPPITMPWGTAKAHLDESVRE